MNDLDAISRDKKEQELFKKKNQSTLIQSYITKEIEMKEHGVVLDSKTIDLESECSVGAAPHSYGAGTPDPQKYLGRWSPL